MSVRFLRLIGALAVLTGTLVVSAAATDMPFRIGRLEFLRRTLDMPHLFLTTEGGHRWDERARANIAWEIATLADRQGLIERAISAVRKRYRTRSD